MSNSRDNNFPYERRSHLEAEKTQVTTDAKKFVIDKTKDWNVETQKEY